MKIIVLLVCLFCCGCWIHGEGSTIGYVTTVEDNSVIFGWDTVWFRVETGTYSSMQSKPEAYNILNSNTKLKNDLLKTAKKNQKIELVYQKHVLCTSHLSDNEVIGYKIVE